jgi:hypothetical protein
MTTLEFLHAIVTVCTVNFRFLFRFFLPVGKDKGVTKRAEFANQVGDWR